jgi:hypothetical protein
MAKPSRGRAALDLLTAEPDEHEPDVVAPRTLPRAAITARWHVGLDRGERPGENASGRRGL